MFTRIVGLFSRSVKCDKAVQGNRVKIAINCYFAASCGLFAGVVALSVG
jgi:hypothetical protein